MFGDLCKWVICMYLQYNTIMLCFYIWKCFPCTEISFKTNRKCKMRIFHLHSVKGERPLSYYTSLFLLSSHLINQDTIRKPHSILFSVIWEHQIFSPLCAFCLGNLFPGRVFAGGQELGFGLSSKAERGVFKLRGAGARLPAFESWLRRLPALWPWETSLCLSFLLCYMVVITPKEVVRIQ